MGYHKSLLINEGEPEPDSQDDYLQAVQQNKGRHITTNELVVDGVQEAMKVNYVFNKIVNL